MRTRKTATNLFFLQDWPPSGQYIPLRLVIRRGAELAAIGIGAGLFAALAVMRLISSLLFGTTATDLATFSTVSLILLAVTLTATSVPALRATRVDPLVALREDAKNRDRRPDISQRRIDCYNGRYGDNPKNR